MITALGDTCEILDSRRSPINSSERNKRIEGKSDSELFPYYGATGEAGKIDGYIFDGEHVLIGEDAAPFLEPHRGVSYLVTGKFWVNNHAHILKHPTSNRFLCHYLRQVNYRPFVTGTTRLKLNQEQLRKIPIPLPPHAEQRRIVAKIEELFSELDAGEESLRRARRQLGVYRQSLLKQAFEGKLTEHWRKENSQLLESSDQLLNRIQAERKARFEQQMNNWKDSGKQGAKARIAKLPPALNSDELSSLPELPTAWRWEKNERYLFEVKDGTHDTPKYVAHGIPFITQKNIKNDAIDFFNVQFISEDDHARFYSRSNVACGDLIISMIGHSRGNCCLVRSERVFSIKNVGLFKFFNELQSNECLRYYYQSTVGQNLILEQSKGGAQPFIGLTELRNWPVPLCSLAEQQEIVRLLDEQFTVIEQNEREIDAALKRSAVLRQSILKKAFTGQLVPQDPTDEPATALLERIRNERVVVSAKTPKTKIDKKRASRHG